MLYQDNEAVKAHSYCVTTATGSLQGHLLEHHGEEWMQECQKLKVYLRGREGVEVLTKVTGVSVKHLAEAWSHLLKTTL